MKPFTITVVLGLTATMAFNYTIDPQGHRARNAYDLRTNWRRDQMLVLPMDAGDRPLRVAHMRVAAKPDVLILGSSRAMPIDSSYFAPGLIVYNAGMTGASIEDYAGMWQHLKELGKTPRWLVIVADPWILNRNSHLIRWRENMELFEHFSKEAGLSRRGSFPRRVFFLWQRARHAYTLVCELLSWTVTTHSAKLFLTHGLTAPPKLTVTTLGAKPKEFQAWRRDGALIIDGTQPQTTASLRELVNVFTSTLESSSLAQYAIDPQAIDVLDAILRLNQEAGGRATMILPPYHLQALVTLARNPRYRSVFSDFTTELKRLSDGGRRFALCDAINPAFSGCTEMEFLDAMHARPECLRKVVSRCLSLDPGARELMPLPSTAHL